MGARSWRRAAQSVFGCLALACGTLLLYQAGAGPVAGPRAGLPLEGPGPVPPLEVVTPPPPATATPRPLLTSLQDLFISVKTTRHYHDLRLPIILKTWFQLAREQVCLHFVCFGSVFCVRN